MMRPIAASLLIPALIAAAPPRAAPAEAPPRAAIVAALDASAAGWNAGDLDRFVAIYALDATFVTRTGLVQGREAIAGHYRASFAGGRNVRGRLGFMIAGLRVLSAVHVLVFARYHLDGVGAGEDGPTTLLFERRREGWRIIADHSG